MFDFKFIPMALALYNKESNGKQLLFSRCTTFGIGRWAVINAILVPYLFYKGRYAIQEHRRQKSEHKKEEAQWARFNADFAAWKANGKEIAYTD